jgi:hypothetical protein
MNINSEIVVGDAKDAKGLSKEYTDITLHLLKELIKMSDKTNYLTQSVINYIIQKLASDTEWFIRETCMFFWTVRNQIKARDFKFFISFDYKEQIVEWNKYFGETASNTLLSIIRSGITKTMSDPTLAEESIIYFNAILRKCAAYIYLFKSNKSNAK